MAPSSELTAARPASAPPSGRDDSAGSRSTANPVGGRFGLCVFDLPSGRFGLDVQLVGEVIVIDRLIAVPRAPHGVGGLFNLRGLPVALIDLAIALDLPAPAAPMTGELVALVLRSGPGVLAAARVTAVRGVVPPAAATVTRTDRDADHAAIVGFVSTPALGVVSVLDGAALTERLAKFRYR